MPVYASLKKQTIVNSLYGEKINDIFTSGPTHFLTV